MNPRTRRTALYAIGIIAILATLTRLRTVVRACTDGQCTTGSAGVVTGSPTVSCGPWPPQSPGSIFDRQTA